MKDFYSLYTHGFARIAAVSPAVTPGKPLANASSIILAAQQASAQGAVLAAFPALAVSGASLEDLYFQDALLEQSYRALEQIRLASQDLTPMLVVGAPLRSSQALYSCAVVIHRGYVLGAVPQQAFSAGSYGSRYFAPGASLARQSLEYPYPTIPYDDADWLEDLPAAESARLVYQLDKDSIPCSPGLYFSATDLPGFSFTIDFAGNNGANSTAAESDPAALTVRLDASPAVAGSWRQPQQAALVDSARSRGAILYVNAGAWESSTSAAWASSAFIVENGSLLANSGFGAEAGGAGFPTASEPIITYADIDLDGIALARRSAPGFTDAASVGAPGMPAALAVDYPEIPFQLGVPDMAELGKSVQDLRRPLPRFPFQEDHGHPIDPEEVLNLQASALQTRLRAIGQPKIVLGVSGGLDSTQALLVAVTACDRAGISRDNILAFTLPGFATSQGTKSNAYALCQALGVPLEEIDIRPAGMQILSDLGHPYAHGEPVYDVTFENVQAGLRADYLFRIAGQRGGIVLGTGDLSESSLGWATFGVGDHICHYNVNAGLPKTSMQGLIRWVIGTSRFGEEANAALQAILDTEISPELVPADAQGAMQSTQQQIGPYELQDFHLYWLMRGYKPAKIAFLAYHAWHDATREAGWPQGYTGARHEYSIGEIKHWLGIFVRRFFSQQFKRSTSPNGPEILPGGSLGPLGAWRMPSDISSEAWLADLAEVPEE
ncbi:NAD+ synthetase [Actinobaculum suis]|uniref:Glutamine-dependent NAD(+) synthetase n=1 Tax=Actinobaculum suis TaxID=1657 RepID=A0A0K9EUV5_9ACTO|nr:NAD(+) synthase [Actinobaculum suis]KMY23969.1 hypothetical protein ACU19_01250 [Actinobaculum suis]VDG76040.1 NAD+ synthetase [Actinobaculum suis]